MWWSAKSNENRKEPTNDRRLRDPKVKCLIDDQVPQPSVEPVEAERLIFLMNDEPFDYTKWHGVLSEGKTIEEIHKSAKRRREAEKKNGKA